MPPKRKKPPGSTAVETPNQKRRGARVTSQLALPLAASVACACALMLVPAAADAFEISGGISAGAMLAGTAPRISVTPHAGLSWGLGGGFLFAAHDMFSLLPTSTGGVGVLNEVSIGLGMGWDKGHFSLGPSLSTYTMPVCGVDWCGRVNGLAPGGHAQADVYFVGPLGVSASANVGWMGGSSGVLHDVVTAMFLAGPVLRWEREVR